MCCCCGYDDADKTVAVDPNSSRVQQYPQPDSSQVPGAHPEPGVAGETDPKKAPVEDSKAAEDTRNTGDKEQQLEKDEEENEPGHKSEVKHSVVASQ